MPSIDIDSICRALVRERTGKAIERIQEPPTISSVARQAAAMILGPKEVLTRHATGVAVQRWARQTHAELVIQSALDEGARTSNV